MAKPLAEDLAEFLLNCARGSWTKAYNRQCLALWRTTYGEKIAQQVEAIVRKKWKE